jgi:hypothetical protein
VVTPLYFDYRAHAWEIEGETVAWGIARGLPGWTCTCWQKQLPEFGRRPTCRHTRYVEKCELAGELINESGPKVTRIEKLKKRHP